MSGTEFAQVVETSKVIKFKKGYRYLIAIDKSRFDEETIAHFGKWLREYDIQAILLSADGNPDDFIKIYEAETEI